MCYSGEIEAGKPAVYRLRATRILADPFYGGKEWQRKGRAWWISGGERESAASLKFQIHLRPHCRVLIRFNYEKSPSAADLPTPSFPSSPPPSVSFTFRHTFIRRSLVFLNCRISLPTRYLITIIISYVLITIYI